MERDVTNSTILTFVINNFLYTLFYNRFSQRETLHSNCHSLFQWLLSTIECNNYYPLTMYRSTLRDGIDLFKRLFTRSNFLRFGDSNWLEQSRNVIAIALTLLVSFFTFIAKLQFPPIQKQPLTQPKHTLITAQIVMGYVQAPAFTVRYVAFHCRVQTLGRNRLEIRGIFYLNNLQ